MHEGGVVAAGRPRTWMGLWLTQVRDFQIQKPIQQVTQQPQVDYSLTTLQGSQQPTGQTVVVEIEMAQQDGKWAQQDSNLRPTDYESAALTD